MVLTMLLPVVPLVVKSLMSSSFLRLACVCVADVIIAMPVVYGLLLNRQERMFVTGLVTKKLFKHS